MTGTALVALLAPVATGFFLLCGLWPERRAIRSQLLLKLSLAVGVGWGIASCLFFLCLPLFTPVRRALVIFDVLSFLLALGVYFTTRSTRPPQRRAGQQPTPRSALSWLLALLFCLIALSAAAVYAAAVMRHPHGGWDAWAIWNLRARFLARGGVHWRDAFAGQLAWSHPDYPLLLPGLVARVWAYVGSEARLVPILISFLFCTATVALAVASVTVLRGRSQGLLAGVCLLACPPFVGQAALQYADVPVGYFVLAALVLCACHDWFTQADARFLFWAGVMAGLAAWTKNEGLLYLVSIVLVRVAFAFGWRSAAGRRLGWFVLGALPILAVITLFKTQLAPPNDLLANGGWNVTAAKLADVGRYEQVIRAFAAQWMRFGGGIFVILVCYAVFAGRSSDPLSRLPAAATSAVLAVTVTGFIGVYIVSPHPLSWHLRNSLLRIFVQLWPSIVFVFFLAVATPEERARGARRLRRGAALTTPRRAQLGASVLPASSRLLQRAD
ncbi:MAG: hypothetical protein ACE5I7_08335 [Candidatus Binatia bacterium]